VVRLPSCDPFEACKALDAGAGGVIGPYVETTAQVEGLVGAVKLRPLKGQRLAAALRSRQSIESELASYMEQRNGDKILIVNIESVPTIENLPAICQVPGLDAILIGPHDLSCSLGIPEQYDHPRFDEAVRKILRIAREHGIGAGTHSWPTMTVDRAIELTAAGANLLMHNSDIAAFSKTIKTEIATLRSRLAN
jgi:2-keto-3-deoxy-L-rhamnonate aldolase RhmA